ncbi:beta-lactamase/transpeptidase-like protein [Microthyrium microscopicum]|uniref:Beta-lactamase/transpeptidase-like protein n=1 Tax=Microthyrium microscopicum TaxID=703497 RepID=A0A6A6UTA8_9PEZI|nr:beta-lactamase/transpeptidase-like protein [Microthyrium microscopicum]
MLKTAIWLTVLYYVTSVFASQIPLLADGPRSVQYIDHVEFNSTIKAFMIERNIPGLSLAIFDKSDIVYAAGHGYAKMAIELVNTYHRFRLASISKSITAISIMHLADKGKLNLTNTVFGSKGILKFKYGTKPYTEWEEAITVQHLLEHSSGFVNSDMCGTDCDPTYFPRFRALDQWQLISTLLDEYDPSHEPGTFADYSNFGYFILGRIVEQVSGTSPYETYVREKILRPLGVVDMRIATDQRRNHEVVYYAGADEDDPYEFHVSRRDSVGAWIATPVDLLLISKAIGGFAGQKQLLSDSVRVAMFNETGVPDSHFAKGWTVNVTDGRIRAAWKDGSYQGTSSMLYLDFERNISWAAVANRMIKTEGDFDGSRDLTTLVNGLISKWK